MSAIGSTMLHTHRSPVCVCECMCVYLSVRQGHVHNDRLTVGLSVLQSGVDHLVASDLPVLLHSQGGLPGHSDGGGVDRVGLHLPGRSSGHWSKTDG